MSAPENGNVTLLLRASNAGDQAASDELVKAVYAKLKRLARSYMSRERVGHTLQTTALVNEAYMKLVDQNVQWQDRSHFFGIAAQMMRRILVDHARAKKAEKRGGEAPKVSLDEAMAGVEVRTEEVLALDLALDRLSEIDEQQAKVVELRYFAGLTIDETAETLGISPATVKREWTVARAWLYRELRGNEAS